MEAIWVQWPHCQVQETSLRWSNFCGTVYYPAGSSHQRTGPPWSRSDAVGRRCCLPITMSSSIHFISIYVSSVQFNSSYKNSNFTIFKMIHIVLQLSQIHWFPNSLIIIFIPAELKNQISFNASSLINNPAGKPAGCIRSSHQCNLKHAWDNMHV